MSSRAPDSPTEGYTESSRTPGPVVPAMNSYSSWNTLPSSLASPRPLGEQLLHLRSLAAMSSHRVGKHPGHGHRELMPQLWKIHFTANRLRSDL